MKPYRKYFINALTCNFPDRFVELAGRVFEKEIGRTAT